MILEIVLVTIFSLIISSHELLLATSPLTGFAFSRTAEILVPWSVGSLLPIPENRCKANLPALTNLITTPLIVHEVRM